MQYARLGKTGLEVSRICLGCIKLEQLADAVAAVDLKLGSDEVARLEAPYVPTGRGSFN